MNPVLNRTDYMPSRVMELWFLITIFVSVSTTRFYNLQKGNGAMTL